MIAGVVVPTLPGECGASRRVAIATPSTEPAVTASRQCRLARVGGSTLKPYPVPRGLPTRARDPRAFATCPSRPGLLRAGLLRVGVVRLELQRERVDAVALTTGLTRPVREDVAEMRAAVPAGHLGA